jgi:hypothetical protein
VGEELLLEIEEHSYSHTLPVPLFLCTLTVATINPCITSKFVCYRSQEIQVRARHQWIVPVVPTALEVEIGKIIVP